MIPKGTPRYSVQLTQSVAVADTLVHRTMHKKGTAKVVYAHYPKDEKRAEKRAGNTIDTRLCYVFKSTETETCVAIAET